jgi:hypothetical protein
VLGGTPGAGFNFDLPANVERLFAVNNDSGQTATVQVTGGAGANVAVSTGTTRILHSDGTDAIAIT